MPETAENYPSKETVSDFRKQATRVWLATVVFVFVWVLAIVLPPLFAVNGLESAAKLVFNFFSYICHQIPERSFHFLGHQHGVCSRCFGVYFGLLLGVAIYPLWRKIEEIEPLPRYWLFLSLVPIGIDWSLGVFGIWENTQLSRFVTGLILGLGCATFIVPALVEIRRNIGGSGRRRRPNFR
ncbi:MAG: DUF2085 domain-containing protein [Blastocatellia bacterium]